MNAAPPGFRGLTIALGLGGALSIIPAMSLSAQQRAAAIEGRVTEAENARPLSGALVTIEGTALRATTDARGAYRLAQIPPGPHVVLVRFLGYAPARIPVTVPMSGSLTVDATLARSALKMADIVVTADPTGRATGEQGTATVIERDAIDNQTATSLAGVLELVPGVPLSPPGLDGVEQFALRSVPTGALASLTTGGPTPGDLASLGTLIMLDGVPLSNNANLQTTGPRGELDTYLPRTAGGGIDLRRIPASTIERVEVIRGVPSARYGDLTQGVIVVETRAGAVLPRVAARGDESTVGGSGVFGVGVGAGALTGNLDVTRTRLDPGRTDDDAFRFAGQVAHRLVFGGSTPDEPGTVVLDSRIDAFALNQNSPERPDLFPGQTDWNHDKGIRLAERLRARLGASGTLRVIASLDYQRQRSFAQAPRIRGATPFTDRLTEGTQEGHYVLGQYLSAIQLDGNVWNGFAQIEYGTSARLLGAHHQLLGGAELRREWNTGAGYTFDIEFPPQVTFNGVQGYDRPRRFDSIPPFATTALYLDDRLSAPLGSVPLSLQAGVRLDLLHRGTTWFSAVRDAVLQPRLNVELAPRSWLRLRGGIGRTAKSPTLGQLYPAPQYFDVVNFNWFPPNPAEQLAILTTFIRDPTNPDLGFTRAWKREAGFELGGARGGPAVGVVYFADRTTGGIGFRPDPGFLVRDLYDLADSTTGTGVKPPVIMPPTRADTVPILLDVPANILTLDNRGVEFTATLPELKPAGLQLQVQGALVHTRFESNAPDFGRIFRDFQVNGSDPRSPYWSSLTQTADRAIMTYRLVLHRPELGLVVTGVFQHILHDVTEDEAATDTLSFSGYITRTGELVPVPPERRGDPEFADLRVERAGISAVRDVTPADWIASLQVRKTLPAGGQLSFYAFNVFDRVGRVGRTFPSIRFGIELSMPLGGFVGSRVAP
jgi:outer membrane receptor protein involved in Fe transport